MRKRSLVLTTLSWLILLCGLSVFLFVKETTLTIRLFSILCCVVAFVISNFRSRLEK